MDKIMIGFWVCMALVIVLNLVNLLTDKKG